jgi:hypothetical protein
MKIRYKAILAGLLAGMSLVLLEVASAEGSNPLHLQNGKVLINNQEQRGNFSAVLSNFKFLYFYVPSRGLFILSDKQFGRAVQAGAFEDRQLSFDLAGIEFKLISSRPILGEARQPLWVYHDPSFTLDVKSIMFGYGDTESAPYDWPKQIGKHP